MLHSQKNADDPQLRKIEQFYARKLWGFALPIPTYVIPPRQGVALSISEF
jgi:hypothetical protein